MRFYTTPPYRSLAAKVNKTSPIANIGGFEGYLCPGSLVVKQPCLEGVQEHGSVCDVDVHTYVSFVFHDGSYCQIGLWIRCDVQCGVVVLQLVTPT